MKHWSHWHAGTRAALVAVAIWLMVGVLHITLLYQQLLRSKKPIGLPEVIGNIFTDYFFLLIGSACLALAFVRWQQAMLRPRFLLLLGTLYILLIPILMQASAVLAELWLHHKPWSSFGKVLMARSKFSWWIEVCMALAGFAMQAAHAAWRSGAQQNEAWQREEAAQLELRLRLLQGQLKPHFLFNALNSISALVRTAERDLASAALRQLRDLLRYVVHASEHEWLPMAAEMTFLHDYMALQRLRHGERLGVTWQIPEMSSSPWKDLSCPPMLFQPLLENAIVHALEVQRGTCAVQIRLWLEGGIVAFEVSNPLFPQSRSRKGHGVGLAGIKTRLATLYAGEAKIEAAPDPASGLFVACLSLPATPLPVASTPAMAG